MLPDIFFFVLMNVNIVKFLFQSFFVDSSTSYLNTIENVEFSIPVLVKFIIL